MRYNVLQLISDFLLSLHNSRIYLVGFVNHETKQIF